MSRSDTESALEFPCSFPVKMMGRDQESFRASAIDLVSRHAGEIKEDSISYAPSRNGNFLSITIVIEAKSQQQLDDLYTDLSNNDEILVAL